MTKGSCDPSPEPYNMIELAKGGGAIDLVVRWSWDGVSAWPNCAGPVLDIRVRNTTADTWYAHLPHKVRGLKVVTIDPFSDVTYSGATLAQAGLDTVAAIDDLTIDQEP